MQCAAQNPPRFVVLLLLGAKGGRPSDYARVGLLPLVDAIAEGLVGLEGLLAKAEPGSYHDVFVTDAVPKLRRDVVELLEANVEVLTSAVVPGLRGDVDRADGISVADGDRPLERLVLGRMPQEIPSPCCSKTNRSCRAVIPSCIQSMWVPQSS